MRWHLCNPLGVSERTAEADDLFWARRRFAPIPKGWFVVADVNYRTPRIKVEATPVLCSKCMRHPVTDGFAQCDGCRKTKREAYRTKHGLDPLPPKTEWKERRTTLAEMDLRTDVDAPVLRTSEAAKRLGVATNSVNAIMKQAGYAPLAGYAPKVGRAGRTERQWVESEVMRVKYLRMSKQGARATIRSFRAKRHAQTAPQLTLGV